MFIIEVQNLSGSIGTGQVISQDVLKYAIDSGMLDINQIVACKEMTERKKYLEGHKYWYNESRGAWLTFLPDPTKAHGRRQVKRKNKKDLEDVIVEYYKGQKDYQSVMDIVTAWITRKVDNKQISLSTRDRYQADAKRYLSSIAEIDVSTITLEQMTTFLEDSVGKLNLSSKAYGNMKTILKGAFSYAYREKWVNFRIDDAISDADIPKKAFKKVFKEDEEEVFNEEEAAKLVKFLMADLKNQKHIILLLAFLTGMRVGEACTIKHQDIVDNTIRIRRTNTRYKDAFGKYHYGVKDFAKTEAGMRTVVIPDDFRWITSVLENTNPDSEYVFLDQTGKPFSDNAINNRLRAICDKLHIPRRSPHKLRKTWFSILMDNHVDNNLVTKIGGHTNIVTSERNYHRNRKSLDAMTQVVSSIPEFQMDDEMKEILGNQKQSGQSVSGNLK